MPRTYLQSSELPLEQPRPWMRARIQLLSPLQVDLGILALKVLEELLHLLGGEHEILAAQLLDAFLQDAQPLLALQVFVLLQLVVVAQPHL